MDVQTLTHVTMMILQLQMTVHVNMILVLDVQILRTVTTMIQQHLTMVLVVIRIV